MCLFCLPFTDVQQLSIYNSLSASISQEIHVWLWKIFNRKYAVNFLVQRSFVRYGIFCFHRYSSVIVVIVTQVGCDNWFDFVIIFFDFGVDRAISVPIFTQVFFFFHNWRYVRGGSKKRCHTF